LCLEDGPEFKNTLDILFEMKEVLEEVLPSGVDSLFSPFRVLGDLIDRLLSLLGKEMEDKAEVYFSSESLTLNRHPEYSDLDLCRELEKLGSLPLYRKIQMQAAIKRISLLTMKSTSGNSRQIDSRCIGFGSWKFGDHDLGMFTNDGHSHRVLIEWRNYNLQNDDELVSQKLFVRLEAIVDLLNQEKPEEFRCLPCRGFFHFPSRCGFGVVYDLPPSFGSGESRIPMDLLSLMEANSGIRGISVRQPLLEDKFRLAYVLAKALLEFHMVGWLHKELSPTNVAFFPLSNTPIPEYIKEPYIIGFNHSRPDEPSAFTEGMPESNRDDYQHPTYRKKRRGYRSEYDYYSLGILLLEIGIWTSLKLLTTDSKDRKDSKDWLRLSATEFQRKLLESRVPLLGPSMGATYREAVRVCIEGDFGVGVSSDDTAALHRAFESRVVAPLKGVMT